MSGFSSALKLTDLNDFIQPSQACVKPVETGLQKTRDDSDEIRINRGKAWKSKAKRGEESGNREQPKVVTPLNVTLGDCLACSGCITSAEAVLIAEQSHQKVFEVLESKNSAPATAESLIVVLSLSLQSIASLGAKYGLSMEQTALRLSHFFHQLGVDYVCDIALARHICLLESAREFVRHHNRARHLDSSDQNTGPLLSSTCPGFVCYAEKSQGTVLVPLLSQVKSPQQIMGILVKKRLDRLRKAIPSGGDNLNYKQVYHITLMPCYDKKLEASRLDNRIDPTGDSSLEPLEPVPEVDCVITPIEVEKMLEIRNVQSFSELPERKLDQIYPQFYSGLEGATSSGDQLRSHLGSGSGGYAENIFRYVASELYNWSGNSNDLKPITSLSWKAIRNADYMELNLYSDRTTESTAAPSTGDTPQPPLLSFAILNGFRNVQNLVSRLKRRTCHYDYVEVAACPKGCLNGGAQLRAEGTGNSGETYDLVQKLYDQLEKTEYGLSAEENSGEETVIPLDQLSHSQMRSISEKNDQLYRDLEIDDQLRKQMHTKFAAIPKTFSILNSNW